MLDRSGWCARLSYLQYDGADCYEYLGFPEYTHIVIFESCAEAIDRLRSIGFSYERIDVVVEAGRVREFAESVHATCGN
jgi:hypothetical protein